MESYPSINTIVTDATIYAFDKLDGSNIRAEWTRKTGFTKFGTRHRLLDENEPLGEAISLFQNKYADDLERVFRAQKFEKATAFFEFYGKNSFAGQHEDEEHFVTMFDLHICKKGLLPPKEFLKAMNGLETAPLLYQGKANQPFIESVKNSTLEYMTLEGVVCKGDLDNRRRPIMFKIKSEAWLARLKEKYGHDEQLLRSLI